MRSLLTSLASAAVVLILAAVNLLLRQLGLGDVAFLVLIPLLAVGRWLSIYLEQLFVTGRYLYVTFPASPVVKILPQDVIGHELPDVGLAGGAIG